MFSHIVSTLPISNNSWPNKRIECTVYGWNLGSHSSHEGDLRKAYVIAEYGNKACSCAVYVILFLNNSRLTIVTIIL